MGWQFPRICFGKIAPAARTYSRIEQMTLRLMLCAFILLALGERHSATDCLTASRPS